MSRARVGKGEDASVPSLGGFPHLARLPDKRTALRLAQLPEYRERWGILPATGLGLTLYRRDRLTPSQLGRVRAWERKHVPDPSPFRRD